MQTQNLAADSSQPLVPHDAAGNPVADAATSTPGPTCTACGDVNLPGSRFCRHCGATIAVASTPLAAPAPVAVSPVAVSPVAVSPVAVSTPAPPEAAATDVTDEQRARQLLDHSFVLAERGDMAGALVAARQSIALAPQVPQGYSMLGLLLERSGDAAQALAAYQKVLQLAPDSRLEQDSVQRLQATLLQRQQVAAAPSGSTSVPVTAAALSTPFAAPATPIAPSATSTTIAPMPGVTAGNAPSSYAMQGNPTPPFDTAPPAAGQASTASVLGSGPAPRAALSGNGLNAPIFDTATTALSQPLWKRVVSQPSFYFRGLPLVAATSFGLLWMMWARSAAPLPANTNSVSTVGVDSIASGGENTGDPSTASGDTAGTATSAPAADNGAANGAPNTAAGAVDANGFPVQNRAAPGAGRAATGARTGARNGGVNAGTPNNGGNARRANLQGNNATRRVAEARPQFASPMLPRPVPPAAPRSLPPVTNYPQLPPAQFNGSPSTGSVPALPPVSDNGVSSNGGSPFNPSSSNRGNYISVGRARPNTATAPVRPANRAAAAERNAANDLRSGRTDRAIENLTPNLDRAGDTGWRYQQRALAFLERGDNQRAADDFQTAISAYRDQIRRGERSSEALAGINACQSGLKLALTNLHR